MNRAIAIILILSLFSCSSSGGGKSQPNTNFSDLIEQNSWVNLGIDQSEIELYKTPEYYNQSSYDIVNLAQSYAILDYFNKSERGEGVSAVVIDSGLDINHLEFENHYNVEDSYNFIDNNNDVSTGNNSHGTMVSSIISAKKDGNQIHGIAYKNNITSFKIIDQDYDSSSGQFYENIPDNSIINLSWIIDGNITESVIEGLKEKFLQLKNRNILSIAATGNDSLDQPSYPARLANDSNLHGSIIAVGAVDQSKNIADFSSNCGDAMNFCLVAPGVEIYTAHSSTGSTHYYNRLSEGTSYAAPHVAGAAILLKSAWPHLTSAQLSEILLSSATDIGIKGVDPIYGKGLLNIAEAVSASGQNLLLSGSSLKSKGYELSDSAIFSSPLFGDAYINIIKNLEKAVFFDDYGRDYKANLANKILFSNNSLYTIRDQNNHISNKILPHNFKDSSAKLYFNINYFQDNNMVNKDGLKFSVTDNSQNINISSNNGFSFSQNFKDYYSKMDFDFGFAYNFNHTELGQSKKLIGGGRMRSFFYENPFSSFVNSYDIKLNNNRNFHQIFFGKDFFNNHLNITSSYQLASKDRTFKEGVKKQNSIMDMTMSYKINNDTILASLGQLYEFNNNILNSKNYGAFSNSNDTKTKYLKFTYQKKLSNNLAINTSIAHSFSKIEGNDIGIFRGYNDVAARSLGFNITHNNIAGGVIGFNYVEPMAVYKGKLHYDIAIARSDKGDILRESGVLSLKPRGRERNFEIFYDKYFDNNLNINLEAIYQKNPNNNIYNNDNKLISIYLKKLF